MPRTVPDPLRPASGYFAYWIDRLRIADALPAALANRSVRAAIHEAPPACRPPPLEAWLFEAATGHGDGIGCGHVVGWLRLRRALGDGAGLVDPETARYWHRRLGVPPRFPGPRWARRVRAVARDAEPLGFGLSPRLVAAFCAHPAWARDYLRCATFKAWLAAAEDPELAELPPRPAGRRRRANFALPRKIAINLIGQGRSTSASLRGRRKKATWNNGHTLQLLQAHFMR